MLVKPHSGITVNSVYVTGLPPFKGILLLSTSKDSRISHLLATITGQATWSWQAVGLGFWSRCKEIIGMLWLWVGDRDGANPPSPSATLEHDIRQSPRSTYLGLAAVWTALYNDRQSVPQTSWNSVCSIEVEGNGIGWVVKSTQGTVRLITEELAAGWHANKCPQL